MSTSEPTAAAGGEPQALTAAAAMKVSRARRVGMAVSVSGVMTAVERTRRANGVNLQAGGFGDGRGSSSGPGAGGEKQHVVQTRAIASSRTALAPSLVVHQ